MAIIRVHTPDEYITLINLFTVRPEDQLGLTRVQLGDAYWYGKRQPGALSANFHRSLDGVRFFNYAQWLSLDALTRARETPEFKAHIGNYRYFEMSSDPGLYEVVRTTGGRPLAIRWPSRVTVTLRVLSIRPADQGEALRIVEEGLQALEQAAGLVGAALHRGLDGGRVAVYAQWCDEAAIDAAITLPGYQAAEGALAAIEHTSDLRVYEIAGTSEDLSPAPPGR